VCQVGNCPLLRLEYASRLTGCNVLAKAEFANPGGSIKDRAALYAVGLYLASPLLACSPVHTRSHLPRAFRWMIKDAEKRGVLVRGEPGIVVEGTAGNTGIGLALAAGSMGYGSIICMAEARLSFARRARVLADARPPIDSGR